MILLPVILASAFSSPVINASSTLVAESFRVKTPIVRKVEVKKPKLLRVKKIEVKTPKPVKRMSVGK